MLLSKRAGRLRLSRSSNQVHTGQRSPPTTLTGWKRLQSCRRARDLRTSPMKVRTPSELRFTGAVPDRETGRLPLILPREVIPPLSQDLWPTQQVSGHPWAENVNNS